MKSSDASVDSVWIMGQLRWSLESLASPADVQVSVFPSFVCIADELALEFDHWSKCTIGNFGGEMTEDQREALALVDQQLASISRTGPEYSPDLWEPESLSSHPIWQEVRELAKRALLAFAWPLERPGPVSGAYVTKGRMYQDGRERRT